MIFASGDDIQRYGEQLKTNFASINYQHTDHSGLTAHLADRLGVISNYPEQHPRSLERLIAQRLGIAPECVMVTNGTTEAIYLIAQLYSHYASIIPQPTYTEYADACRLHHHVITYEGNSEQQELPKNRVYWICNPNNPSGNVLMKGFVDYVVRRSPDYTFVVDQSLEAYTREPLLVAREMRGLPNLLMLHSLSKTYGVPGLRLGYVTSDPITIEQLRALQHPWSVSAISIEAGKYLMTHGRPAVADIDAYISEAERLRTALRQVEGLRVFETKTAYMLCELAEATAGQLKDYLIGEHGLLIHDCSDCYGLGNHFFRVTAQQADENDALVAAIRQFMEEKKEKR